MDETYPLTESLYKKTSGFVHFSQEFSSQISRNQSLWLSMMTTKPLNISAASIISALLAICSPLKSILSPISIYLVRVLSTLYDISLFHIPILFNFTE